MSVSELSPIILWFLLCILLSAVFYLIVRLVTAAAFYRQQLRLRQGKTIIHEYAAPPNLTPAEVGYIFDRRFTSAELGATVVQLLQQKILIARYIDNQLHLHLASKKRHTTLDWVALEVVGYISAQQGTVAWSTLIAELGLYGTFQQGLEKQIKRQLAAKNYLNNSDTAAEDLVRKWLRNVLGLVLSLGFVLIPLNQVFASSRFGVGNGYGDVDYAIIFFLACVVVVILWPLWNSYVDLLARIYLHGCGLPIDATNQLRQQWRNISGYRVFLTVVESERLKTTPVLSSETLPWCMALGKGPTLEEVVKASRTA